MNKYNFYAFPLIIYFSKITAVHNIDEKDTSVKKT